MIDSPLPPPRHRRHRPSRRLRPAPAPGSSSPPTTRRRTSSAIAAAILAALPGRDAARRGRRLARRDRGDRRPAGRGRPAGPRPPPDGQGRASAAPTSPGSGRPRRRRGRRHPDGRRLVARPGRHCRGCWRRSSTAPPTSSSARATRPGGGVVDWGIVRRRREPRRQPLRPDRAAACRPTTSPAASRPGARRPWPAVDFAGVHAGGYVFQVEMTYRAQRRRRAHPRGPDHLPRPSRRPEQDEPPDHRRGARRRPPAALGRAARPRTPARGMRLGEAASAPPAAAGRARPRRRPPAPGSGAGARHGDLPPRPPRRLCRGARSPASRSSSSWTSAPTIPSDLFPGLPVVGKRRLPITRIFRSGALTLDPFLVRGASLGTGRGARA